MEILENSEDVRLNINLKNCDWKHKKLYKQRDRTSSDIQTFQPHHFETDLIPEHHHIEHDKFFLEEESNIKSTTVSSVEGFISRLEHMKKTGIPHSFKFTNKGKEDLQNELDEKLEDECYLIKELKKNTDTHMGHVDIEDEDVYDILKSNGDELKKVSRSLKPKEVVTCIKTCDTGKPVELWKIEGFFASKMLNLLCAVKAHKRPIYLTRHGQSEFNVHELIGGDSSLTERGRKYGQALKDFFTQYHKTEKGRSELNQLKKYWSNYVRTHETIAYLDCFGEGAPSIRSEIDEINAGICDSITYDDVKIKYPEEAKKRSEDKLYYRYPEGESYIDMINRVEPFNAEIESWDKPMFVTSHQALLRWIFISILAEPADQLPFISVPLHTLTRLEPEEDGFVLTTYIFNIESGEYSSETKKLNYTFIIPKNATNKLSSSDNETDDSSSD